MDPLGLINTGASQSLTGPGRAAPLPGAGTQGPSFKDVLMKNIEEVNRLQQDAEMAIEDLNSGKRDDMAAVFIAKQKADMAFQLLLQVRNKLMDAYTEIKEMRV